MADPQTDSWAADCRANAPAGINRDGGESSARESAEGIPEAGCARRSSEEEGEEEQQEQSVSGHWWSLGSCPVSAPNKC
jgi:hypothetical protein